MVERAEPWALVVVLVAGSVLLFDDLTDQSWARVAIWTAIVVLSAVAVVRRRRQRPTSAG